ncbi:MAG: helix-turn-helix domain-containing protein [Steroidobacteraceae bacterium]
MSERLESLLSRAIELLEKDRQEARKCLSDVSVLLRLRDSDAIPKESAAIYRSLDGGLLRWQAKRILIYIETKIGSKVTVAELAARLTLSPSYFSRAFKRSFGLSPMTYVIVRRVERAKVLMMASRDQLSSIARRCGFADQAHLSRSFRRVVGVSPALWRRYSQLEPEPRIESFRQAEIEALRSSNVHQDAMDQRDDSDHVQSQL